MFKYNTLSDLKDGTCVTPIRKDGINIICMTDNDIEISKLLSDFDFVKKPEERGFVLAEDTVQQMAEDLKDAIIEPEKIEFPKEPQKIEFPKEPQKIEFPKESQKVFDRKNTKVTIETQIIRGIK